MNSIIQIIDWLTAPHVTIQQRDQRRQARLLSFILLFSLIFGIFAEFVLEPLFASGSSSTNWLSFISIFGLVLIGYILSRSRFREFGTLCAVLSFSGAVFVQFIVPDITQNPSILNYLIVSVILSNLFGSYLLNL